MLSHAWVGVGFEPDLGGETARTLALPMEGWWRSNMNWNSLFSTAWKNEILDAGVEMLNGDSKLKNW